MKRRREWGIGLMLILCSAAAAAAQEQRQTGLVINSAPAVGLIWHVSDRVAIRPEVSFSRSTVESERSSGDITTSAGSVAVSALFTMRRWDDLSAYLSPRFSFLRSSGTSVLSSGSTTSTFETTNTTYGFSGSFGLQYGLGERFAVFGETGLSYATQTTASDLSSLGDTDARTFSLRSALGLVFYF